MIDQIEFQQRCHKWDQMKYPDKPEYAFIGRSNVGKSSLINQLAGRKNLAEISGNPGKTRHIDLFVVNNRWNLVDLPGYGYAKMSKKAREAWLSMMEAYFLNRPNLANVFVLIDASIPPKAVDLEFTYWLGMHEVPFSMVYTKTDKAKSAAVDDHIQQFEEKMQDDWEALPPTFRTSAKNGYGAQTLLNYIASVNQTLLAS